MLRCAGQPARRRYLREGVAHHPDPGTPAAQWGRQWDCRPGMTAKRSKHIQGRGPTEINKGCFGVIVGFQPIQPRGDPNGSVVQRRVHV